MRPLAPLALALCLGVSGTSVVAQGPLARSVTAEATRLAAGAEPRLDCHEHTDGIEVRWSELAPLIVGRDVTVRLADGSSFRGELLVVRDDALVVAGAGRTAAKAVNGSGAIERSLVQRIIVRKTTGAWGRHLGTVIGVMTGLLVGGYVTGQVADSAGVGSPLFLTLASGMTVAGYYTGRQLDTRVTVIRIVPDRPQQRDRHLPCRPRLSSSAR